MKVQIGAAIGEFKNRPTNRTWKLRILDISNEYRTIRFNGKNLKFDRVSLIDSTNLANETLFKEVTIIVPLTSESLIILNRNKIFNA